MPPPFHTFPTTDIVKKMVVSILHWLLFDVLFLYRQATEDVHALTRSSTGFRVSFRLERCTIIVE
jgi:hypothetical protein